MKKLSILVLLIPFITFSYQGFSVEATTNLTKDPNYNTIYNAMTHLKSSVMIKKNGHEIDVFNQVLDDHPEIFYINYEKTLIWSNGKLEIVYNGSTKTIKAQIASLNKKINAIYNRSKAKSTRDKIKDFHDYIIDHAKFDYTNYQKGTIPESSYNAYGVLVKGVGVCQGYADSMKLLLNKAKIPNYFVVGTANNEPHAWNLVKVGSRFYHVDTTWDDPITSSGKPIKTYRYFMMNDSQMKKDHRWNPKNYPRAI
ncbi:transglutaminase domain-containing protein [Cytobacillus sp. Hz8]|uniref:transglutaminase domain-containing protein n=1 Tax=Cytobacillus sp. Hz8 TaxID=3347168 RepID=UPI0035DED1FC